MLTTIRNVPKHCSYQGDNLLCNHSKRSINNKSSGIPRVLFFPKIFSTPNYYRPNLSFGGGSPDNPGRVLVVLQVPVAVYQRKKITDPRRTRTQSPYSKRSKIDPSSYRKLSQQFDAVCGNVCHSYKKYIQNGDYTIGSPERPVG